MRTEVLTTTQAGKIHEALCPTLDFLIRLECRLAEMGLRPTDGYYRKVREALEVFARLAVETRDLSRKGDVGRPTNGKFRAVP